MPSTMSSVPVIRRRCKRHSSAAGPVATITVTVTTTRGRDSWMHALEARSADELRQIVLRDLNELVQQVWPTSAAN